MRYGLESITGNALETYPYTFKMWKADHPNISVRDDMSLLGEYRVVPVSERGPQPAPSDPMAYRVEKGPEVKTNGAWAETWIEVALTAQEIAQRQARKDDDDARIAVKVDAFVQNFIAMTPAEVASYVGAEVTNLASAKLLLKRMAVMLLLIARREFKD